MRPSYSETPNFYDPKDYGLFRKVLETAGYTNEGVLEILNVKDFPAIKKRDTPFLYRYWLQQNLFPSAGELGRGVGK